MSQDYFKNEDKVRKIGGRLKEDYYTLKRDIEYINDYFFDFFYILNLTDDLDLIIDILNDGLHNLCSVFINKTMRDIEAGKIPKDKFLALRTKAKLEKLPPEEQAVIWERETKRRLKYLYKDIYWKILKENGLSYFETKYSRTHLEICRKALFITPSRIEIDGEKFIEVYTDYIEAEESETKKMHEQAAEAINRFFNGAVEITQKELSKYFVLEYGIVKVNPKSVNVADYARLGGRTCKVINEDSVI